MTLSKRVRIIYESNMSYKQKADELYKLGFRDLLYTKEGWKRCIE